MFPMLQTETNCWFEVSIKIFEKKNKASFLQAFLSLRFWSQIIHTYTHTYVDKSGGILSRYICQYDSFDL